MINPLFDKAVTLARTLVNICELALDEYLMTNNNTFKDIAVMTGMLICSDPDCKRRGIDIVEGKIYCKKHWPV